MELQCGFVHISLVASELEHFFMSVTHSNLARFLTGWFVLSLLSIQSSSSVLDVSLYLLCRVLRFSPILLITFSRVDFFLCCTVSFAAQTLLTLM